jgi:cystinosin
MSPPPQSVSNFLFGTELRTSATLFIGVTILGTTLGLSVPGSSSLYGPWRFWSNLIGWMYFSAWSVSFWPQVIMIAQRKHVSGLSFDYLALNLVGFSCYSSYNLALYGSATVRAQYAVAHPNTVEHPNSASPAVELNDVFFGLHAIFATLVSIAQCCIYPRDPLQRISRGGGVWLAVLITSVIAYALAVALGPNGGSAADTGAGARGWLAFFTFVSYVKLAISLTKYAPQVYLNYTSKSTVGWSIHNVMLDFAGGSLSVIQLIGDASQKGLDAV